MKSENSIKEIERIRELLLLNASDSQAPKLTSEIQLIEDRLQASDKTLLEHASKLDEQAKRISKLETLIAAQIEEIKDLRDTQIGLLGRVTKRLTNRE